MDEEVHVAGFKIELSYVIPNGYQLKELYGDVDSNGVINGLVRDGYEKLEKQRNALSQQL